MYVCGGTVEGGGSSGGDSDWRRWVYIVEAGYSEWWRGSVVVLEIRSEWVFKLSGILVESLSIGEPRRVGGVAPGYGRRGLCSCLWCKSTGVVMEDSPSEDVASFWK